MAKQRYEYTVGENEHRNYFLLIENNNTHVLHQHICFYLESNAVLVAEILIIHKDVELTIECILAGQGAQARIVGAYGACINDIVRIKTVQYHGAPYSRSSVVMRGVVRGSAQAFYHGAITVARNMHGCDASQENKNMLIGNSARAVSEPQLEVLTNDVRCFHGSATGRCDDEQLFYCATRGINEKKAQQLLLYAFFSGLFVSEALKEKIVQLIE